MTNEIDQVKTEAANLVLERISSPLIFSFVLAWCGWNYRTLLILLSENSVSVKLRLLSELAYPDWSARLLDGFAAPLAVALAYVFAYPHLERSIYAYQLRQKAKREALRRRIEEAPMLSQPESDALRKKMENAEAAKLEALSQLSEAQLQFQATQAALTSNFDDLQRSFQQLIVGTSHFLAGADASDATEAEGASRIDPRWISWVLRAVAKAPTYEGVLFSELVSGGNREKEHEVAVDYLVKRGVLEAVDLSKSWDQCRIRFRLSQ